ncbi:nicotinate-nucleotide adenylyltransferase [Synergistes jonesii]|nr:nicotinate-nucleotide adenylyltransferase [Synergistes jonesii]OFB61714.1 nicotinate-nucleotide adenylyltransferase [Synergistes jonesii]OFB63207.1 nicotinate-nucleotide adenylyltransferase [Synergistes jonesii]OFB64079.1 nicotinate-nucleotide adenylyltransferase [Synergistes jonesii]OFB67913.1 nicotinate-nucleotide adenylyltransferase [Synergistes jonesii]OFB72499.1 nicotinate-nucleotide adenylyltransferase [Synergistes jonesii]
MAERRKIGIMGGTFDPIHNGHLLAADEAHAALGLSEVIFVPTGQPPHKGKQHVTSAEDRYIMAELATVNCPYFSVSRVEIDRAGKSYTIDTLRTLRAMPEYEGVLFYFITGLDAVLDIVSWKNPEEIMQLCRFVAVSRYGYTHKRMEELPQDLRERIIPLEIPLLAISSTELRERIKTGRSIKFMVPTAVERFIRKKSLYIN